MATARGEEEQTLQKYFAGFDIGGTKTLALVMGDDGTVVTSERRPRPHSPEETIDQLCELVRKIASDAQVSLGAVGIGIAGAISRAGEVIFSPNIPELFDFPLRDELAPCVDVPVVVDNDATAATWAEHQIGAGQGVDDLLYVALGTGIGTGFVLDGRIYRGAHGFAGESGHIVIDRRGDTHISGVRGPWEMYASGSGLGRMARERATAGRLNSVRDLAGSIESIRGEHVTQAVRAGSSDALDLLDAFAADVAVGLTNLIYVLDPARIVIGGGLVEIGEPLRARVQAAVDETTLGGAYRPKLPVVLAELGSQSAALGAAMLARDSLA